MGGCHLVLVAGDAVTLVHVTLAVHVTLLAHGGCHLVLVADDAVTLVHVTLVVHVTLSGTCLVHEQHGSAPIYVVTNNETFQTLLTRAAAEVSRETARFLAEFSARKNSR